MTNKTLNYIKNKTFFGLRVINEPAAGWGLANAFSGFVLGGTGYIVGATLLLGGLMNAAVTVWKSQQPNPTAPLPETAPKFLKFFSRPSSYFFFATGCMILLFGAHVVSILNQLNMIDTSNWPSWLQVKPSGVSVNTCLAIWAGGQAKANCHFGLRQNKLLQNQKAEAQKTEPSKPASKSRCLVDNNKLKLAAAVMILSPSISSLMQSPSKTPIEITHTAFVERGGR